MSESKLDKSQALSRRAIVGSVLTCSVISALRSQVPDFGRSAIAEEYGNPSTSQPLDDRIPYGAAVSGTALKLDAAYRTRLAESCDLIVPEGALKWDPIQRIPHLFEFNEADFIFNFATQNNLEFRGHTLAWHSALPTWIKEFVKSRPTAFAELQLHIKTVVNRYRGKIRSWDVVNEAIADDPRSGVPLRPSIWTRYLGSEYIDFSFRQAHEADPAARLYLNEYDIEYAGDRFQAKRDALLSLISKLKSKDVPIHGLGIQGHLDPRYSIDQKQLKVFLKEVAQHNVDVMITEMDVPDESLPADLGKRDEMAAGLVRQFLETVFEVVRPAAVITWGISDKYTWVPIYRKRSDGLPNRPLPFDSSMQPKRMFEVITEFRNLLR